MSEPTEDEVDDSFLYQSNGKRQFAVVPYVGMKIGKLTTKIYRHYVDMILLEQGKCGFAKEGANHVLKVFCCKGSHEYKLFTAKEAKRRADKRDKKRRKVVKAPPAAPVIPGALPPIQAVTMTGEPIMTSELPPAPPAAPPAPVVPPPLGCKWLLKLSRSSRADEFVVKEFRNEHTNCECAAKLSCTMIGDILSSVVSRDDSRSDVIAKVLETTGFELNDDTQLAYRAKNFALKRKSLKSYREFKEREDIEYESEEDEDSEPLVSYVDPEEN